MATRRRRESHGFISSWVSQAWWDSEREVIEVEFTDGVRWMYSSCDLEVWKDFKRADSAGSFVRKVLDRKPNERR